MDNLIKRILEGIDKIIEKEKKEEYKSLINKAYQIAIQQPIKALSKEIINSYEIFIDKEIIINAIAIGIKIGWKYPRS